VPKWLHFGKQQAHCNSKINLTATIDKELTWRIFGNFVSTNDFGYDEKLQIKLRVLAPAPNWAVDPTYISIV
jgi:hypothetical protein